MARLCGGEFQRVRNRPHVELLVAQYGPPEDFQYPRRGGRLAGVQCRSDPSEFPRGGDFRGGGCVPQRGLSFSKMPREAANFGPRAVTVHASNLRSLMAVSRVAPMGVTAYRSAQQSLYFGFDFS